MEDLKLLIRDNYEDLARLMDQTIHFLETRSVGSKAVYTVTLVLEEILTNIVKYAFDERGDNEIVVSMRLHGRYLQIEFVDSGRNFDPLAVPPPSPAESILECDEGGLGIHLVRKSAEHVEYRRQGDKNILLVVVNLDVE